MNTETSLNHLTRIENKLNDWYVTARKQRVPSAQLYDRTEEIKIECAPLHGGKPDYTMLPQWVQGRVDGLIKRRNNEIWSEYIVWGVWDEEQDVFYAHYRDYPDEVKQKLAEGDTSMQNHYWLKEERRTDRNGLRTITRTPTRDRFTTRDESRWKDPQSLTEVQQIVNNSSDEGYNIAECNLPKLMKEKERI